MSSIRLTGVRQNNLKNITVEFPEQQLTVITGLSGSGKSSLAFDTLYAEGQRRYIESLSTYTRQFLEKMPKPEVDTVENIPPAIALQQKNHIINSRSTVATQTETLDHLRVLFSKIGKTFCIHCQDEEVHLVNSHSILNWATDCIPGKKTLIIAPLSSPLTTKKTIDWIESAKTQGISRVLIKKKKPIFLDLSEPETLSIKDFHSSEIFAVIDRLKIPENPDQDERARLLDSIEQGLEFGKGEVSFFDIEKNTFKKFKKQFACQKCGLEASIPEHSLFSFNNPMGACPKCNGFGFTLDIDEALVVPDPTKTLKNGAIDPFSKPSLESWQNILFKFSEQHGISIGKRYKELTSKEKKLLWEGDSQNKKPFPGILAFFEQLKKWKYKIHMRVFIRRYQTQNQCLECHGARLKKAALAVRIDHHSIAELLSYSVLELINWIEALQLSAHDEKIARESIKQVYRRLSLMKEVGLGYLTLSRLTKTLSGGEFQRINLATQLGGGLCGTLYVLDEPSIGLHPADTHRLIRILERLRDQGNTLVVVEHDLEIMKKADHIIELGPGAGHNGGEVIAEGTPQSLHEVPGSITGKYLAGHFHVNSLEDRAYHRPSEKFLKLESCNTHNLKKINVQFPLERFVVVTGVSGSGKSSLIHHSLYQKLSHFFYQTPCASQSLEKLSGMQNINGVVLLDQTPIGKNSRSNPATYLRAWDEIRKIFANQTSSIHKGYTAQYFSFNVDGGRCPTCKGEGEITLDMHFMAEIKLICEDCNGKRFQKKILEIDYKGKNIDQILHATIDEAYLLFENHSILQRKLGVLKSVGLGYLQIGQSATTLSGGESQRLKIAATLDERKDQRLLYIFDEPTTGLHPEDIKKLIGVLQELVESKHSVILIEHNLDVIAQADWVIDLGPGGGQEGGQIVAQGTPAEIMGIPQSLTGQFLKKHLNP